jgi:hypothetical protein
MLRKFSDIAVWVVLGVVLALIPIACSSSSDTTTDSGIEHAPDATTRS